MISIKQRKNALAETLWVEEAGPLAGRRKRNTAPIQKLVEAFTVEGVNQKVDRQSRPRGSRLWLLTLLFALYLAPAAAQNDIQLLARPYGDSVLLRLAPTDYPTWSDMRRHGVLIERRKGPNDTWRPISGERLIAYSLEDFIGLTDTDDPHVVAVAEALHGEVEPPAADDPQGPMAGVKRKLDEQEQRYFLAVVNADLSAAAATALGWRMVDHNVVQGVPYTYRVRLLPAEGQESTVFSNEVKLRSNELFPWGPVRQLTVEEQDKKVVLRWPRVPAQQRYVAYYLEASDDGRNFSRLNDVPLIKTDAGPDADFFEHTVALEANYQPRHYRLVGINAFAEVSGPGEVVIAQGIDRSPPPEPGIVRARDNGEGGFDLQWDNPAWPADIEGLRIGRGRNYEGPFEPLHNGVLPPTTTIFTDEEPMAHQQHYYAVMAVDTAGNQTTGRGGMAVWRDVDPPAQPTGLVGRVDTNGNVFLLWEPGEEPDLHGYRVFVSHAREGREYLQVTERILHENFYFDSTTLNVLNEEIYYQIVALDHNFNPSPRSETLTLRRPDTQPPAAPVISGYSARGTAVELRWRPSETPDVTGHEVWRSSSTEAWRPVRRLGVRDTLWLDTTTQARTEYTYEVRAVDEAGLYGSSPKLSLRSGTVTKWEGGLELSRARTQVQGKDREILRWNPPPENKVAGYQLFGGSEAGLLRPLRKFPPTQTEWRVTQPDLFYAVRALYPDGGRGRMSNIAEPAKR